MLDTSAPLAPGKIIAVHINYRSRAAQRGRTPAKPSYFLKPTTSLSSSGAAVERPAGCELLGFEGEIALVIGRRTRGIRPEDGWAAVSHLTAANDFGVYDLRYADKGSNLRSKGADGFTPVGPALLAADDTRPGCPPHPHLAERRPRAGGHDGGPHLPVRTTGRRPLPAHHPRARRRDPHRDAGRRLRRAARRHRGGRGGCADRARAPEHRPVEQQHHAGRDTARRLSAPSRSPATPNARPPTVRHSAQRHLSGRAIAPRRQRMPGKVSLSHPRRSSSPMTSSPRSTASAPPR